MLLYANVQWTFIFDFDIPLEKTCCCCCARVSIFHAYLYCVVILKPFWFDHCTTLNVAKTNDLYTRERFYTKYILNVHIKRRLIAYKIKKYQRIAIIWYLCLSFDFHFVFSKTLFLACAYQRVKVSLYATVLLLPQHVNNNSKKRISQLS